MLSFLFFFNDTATTEIYTLSLHDALPIQPDGSVVPFRPASRSRRRRMVEFQPFGPKLPHDPEGILEHERDVREEAERAHDVKRASGTADRSSLGYAIVLLGAALFVASCFLPYVGYAGLSIPGTKTTTSLYQQLTLGPNGGSSDLSSVLYLFGGVAPVAAVAVVALVRGDRRP